MKASGNKQTHRFGIVGWVLVVMALVAVLVAVYFVYANMNTNESTTPAASSNDTIPYKAPTKEQLEHLKDATKTF